MKEQSIHSLHLLTCHSLFNLLLSGFTLTDPFELHFQRWLVAYLVVQSMGVFYSSDVLLPTAYLVFLKPLSRSLYFTHCFHIVLLRTLFHFSPFSFIAVGLNFVHRNHRGAFKTCLPVLWVPPAEDLIYSG